MKTDHRRVEGVYDFSVSGSGLALKLTFSGRNAKGTPATMTVEMNWYAWPWLVKKVFSEWLSIRSAREREINAINNSFSPNQQ